MPYDTNLITGECTCPDAINRHGGSYDLGAAGRYCKHVLTGIGEATGCPHCGEPLVFDRNEKVPQYYCTNAVCIFSWADCGIDARIVLQRWREQREIVKKAA